jgi:hypothetical protein
VNKNSTDILYYFRSLVAVFYASEMIWYYGSHPCLEILNTLIALANDVKKSISCSEVRIFAQQILYCLTEYLFFACTPPTVIPNDVKKSISCSEVRIFAQI